jgi:hypothetical protein
MRVVDRTGDVGVEMVKALGAPLDSYWYEAIADAEMVMRRGAE